MAKPYAGLGLSASPRFAFTTAGRFNGGMGFYGDQYLLIAALVLAGGQTAFAQAPLQLHKIMVLAGMLPAFRAMLAGYDLETAWAEIISSNTSSKCLM
jgi:hypothetical protein